MVLSDSLLVVFACTLAGGFNHPTTTIIDKKNHTHPPNTTAHNNGTCGLGTRWMECRELDRTITPMHLTVPWILTLATIVVLSMPTVLLRSRHKELGLRVFAGNLLQCLGLLLASSFATDHPSICFTLTIHSCVRLLAQLQITPVGGASWWSLRFLAIFAILALEVCTGPAVSVVRWQDTSPPLTCAYLAHLIGCILPELILLNVRFLFFAARALGYAKVSV
jgi:hypothetical protein